MAPNSEGAWLSAGWLVRDGARYRLTPEGWLRLDELIPALTTSIESG
ncbi:MAG: hypothetical protein HY560_04900 [Gemmatimonadetes bacterium]|nr:hypothetical protein [Gemmatimonadota bacterium]